MMENDNPFLNIQEPKAWGPGSLEMAKPLVEATNIKEGMRVLEVGGGSGQIAATIAKYWNVSVVTLEPWSDGIEIQTYARQQNVENQVLALKTNAQDMPFASGTFDAVISIGSFEMIGEDRPQALAEMVRVAKPGACVGIAEPMCTTNPISNDIAEFEVMKSFEECFRTVDWNCELFRQHGLRIKESYYFQDAYKWWMNYSKHHDDEKDLIIQDSGRWISLGLVVGEKNI